MTHPGINDAYWVRGILLMCLVVLCLVNNSSVELLLFFCFCFSFRLFSFLCVPILLGFLKQNILLTHKIDDVFRAGKFSDQYSNH